MQCWYEEMICITIRIQSCSGNGAWMYSNSNFCLSLSYVTQAHTHVYFVSKCRSRSIWKSAAAAAAAYYKKYSTLSMSLLGRHSPSPSYISLYTAPQILYKLWPTDVSLQLIHYSSIHSLNVSAIVCVVVIQSHGVELHYEMSKWEKISQSTTWNILVDALERKVNGETLSAIQ